MTGVFVGIDVSESALRLAVHQSDHHFDCPLDRSTTGKLIEELKTLQPKLIALAAGRHGSEIPIAAGLHCAALPVMVVNARAVQRFAQKERTAGDQAQMLARFAASKSVERKASDFVTVNEIDALLKRRDQLIAIREHERG